MLTTSWSQWLASTLGFGARHARRRPRITNATRIEALEIRALLTAPTVVDTIVRPQEDQAYPGSVASLGTDLDGNSLTYFVVTRPAHGTLIFANSGTYTYTSALNYNGADSFTFQANDGTSNSNVGTVSLVITPVDDPLTLLLPSGDIQVDRNSSPVRLDPAATVSDADTAVNYGKTQIRTTIYSGNSASDVSQGRILLTVRSEAAGPGTVNVKKSKIFINGDTKTAIASFSGGNQGRSLIITFTSAATQADVNQVLKEISFQASKKATRGIRTLQMTVTAGNQRTFAEMKVGVLPLFPTSTLLG